MKNNACRTVAFICVAALFMVASSSAVDTTLDKEKAQQNKQADHAIKDKKQKERDDRNKSEMDDIRNDIEKMHQRWRKDSGYQ